MEEFNLLKILQELVTKFDMYTRCLILTELI